MVLQLVAADKLPVAADIEPVVVPEAADTEAVLEPAAEAVEQVSELLLLPELLPVPEPVAVPELLQLLTEIRNTRRTWSLLLFQRRK